MSNKFMAEEALSVFHSLSGSMFFALSHGWKLYKNADEEIIKALGLGFCLCRDCIDCLEILW